MNGGFDELSYRWSGVPDGGVGGVLLFGFGKLVELSFVLLPVPKPPGLVAPPVALPDCIPK